MLKTARTWSFALAAAAGIVVTVAVIEAGSGFPVHPLSGDVAYAAQKVPAKPVGAPSGAPGKPGEESQSAAHARKAGVADCLAEVEDLSRTSVAGSYAAISSWSAERPNDHMFTSIVGQTSEGAVAPKALSVLLTSPLGTHRCDRAAVEIHPSTLSCQAIAATLLKPVLEGQVSLSGIPVMQAAVDLRYALIPSPGPGGGCVVVGVRTHLAL